MCVVWGRRCLASQQMFSTSLFIPFIAFLNITHGSIRLVTSCSVSLVLGRGGFSAPNRCLQFNVFCPGGVPAGLALLGHGLSPLIFALTIFSNILITETWLQIDVLKQCRQSYIIFMYL